MGVSIFIENREKFSKESIGWWYWSTCRRNLKECGGKVLNFLNIEGGDWSGKLGTGGARIVRRPMPKEIDYLSALVMYQAWKCGHAACPRRG